MSFDTSYIGISWQWICNIPSVRSVCMKKIKIMVLGLSLIHSLAYGGPEEDHALIKATKEADVNAVKSLLVLLPKAAPQVDVIRHCILYIDNADADNFNFLGNESDYKTYLKRFPKKRPQNPSAIDQQKYTSILHSLAEAGDYYSSVEQNIVDEKEGMKEYEERKRDFEKALEEDRRAREEWKQKAKIHYQHYFTEEGIKKEKERRERDIEEAKRKLEERKRALEEFKKNSPAQRKKELKEWQQKRKQTRKEERVERNRKRWQRIIDRDIDADGFLKDEPL